MQGISARSPVPSHMSGLPQPGQAAMMQSMPVAAPRNSRMVASSMIRPQQLKGLVPGQSKFHPPPAYYPNLSGSETDVSTSTENLTQVRHS